MEGLAVTATFRPKFQAQGPATNCQINGKNLGWLSCTAYAMAMAIDAATLGAKTPSGCGVRFRTGDTTGGLTLNQVAYVAETVYGVRVDVRVGNNVVTPAYAAKQLQAGRGLVLQVNAGAWVNTRFRSTSGPVNHAIYINECRGGTSGRPEEALVYDPAADGRYSSIDQGPTWWPWSLVMKAAAALRPWGDNDPRLLGPGKFYVGIMPDHEPHAHYRFGGHKPSASHWPDRTRHNSDDGWFHSKPDSSKATRIRHTTEGKLFEVWQVANGDEFQGSTEWGGNHIGTEWIARKRLDHWGGST